MNKYEKKCNFPRQFVHFPIPIPLHVWYIHLHLGDFYGKCRDIYQSLGSVGIVTNFGQAKQPSWVRWKVTEIFMMANVWKLLKEGIYNIHVHWCMMIYVYIILLIYINIFVYILFVYIYVIYCDILFHFVVLLNILYWVYIIIFLQQNMFQTLIHLSFDAGLTNRDGFACIKWWIFSPSTAVEQCFYKNQHSRNCQCCWSTCFSNFDVWLIGFTFKRIKPSSYIPTDHWKTISSTDNCLPRFAVWRSAPSFRRKLVIHRVGAGGGEKVTVAKWGVW